MTRAAWFRRFQTAFIFFTTCIVLFLCSTLAMRAAPDESQGVALAALNAFVKQQQLSAPDGVAIDGFGSSVAINGNTAVIGAPGYPFDGTTTPRGAAYVFVRNGDLWTFQAKLVPNDGTADMLFGDSVAISGDIAVIGAPFQDLPGRPGTGAAYVFRRSGNLWSQDTRLVGDATALSFGRQVAIDGTTIVANANDAENRGSAYVFTPGFAAGPGLPQPWNLQQKLLAPNGQPGDRFARGLALRGNTIIAGTPRARVGGVMRGAVFVFNRTSTVWNVEAQPIVAPDGQEDDAFGESVSFDGVRVLIASPEALV